MWYAFITRSFIIEENKSLALWSAWSSAYAIDFPRKSIESNESRLSGGDEASPLTRIKFPVDYLQLLVLR